MQADSRTSGTDNGQATDLEEMSASFTANVWEVKCKAGEKVEKGQVLLILEAMKMEYPVQAPMDGTIVEICVESSSLAFQGDTLLTISPTK